jgi:hypothetical protein
LVAIVYLILDVTNRLVGGARKQNSAVYQWKEKWKKLRRWK